MARISSGRWVQAASGPAATEQICAEAAAINAARRFGLGDGGIVSTRSRTKRQSAAMQVATRRIQAQRSWLRPLAAMARPVRLTELLGDFGCGAHHSGGQEPSPSLPIARSEAGHADRARG